MEKVLLTSICRPKQWKTISTKDLLESGYPVYGANGKIGFYNSYTHEHPTVLITCRGATCGSINISDPKSYVNGNAMALDNLSEEVDLYYLKYYLEYRKLDDIISGSAQPQITGKGLSKVKIPLPPLDQQKKIAAILDAADAYRQKTKALIEKYKELTQSLFLDMFGDPVTNPKGWDKLILSSCFISKKEGTKCGPFGSALKKHEYVDNGIPVWTMYNIKADGFNENKCLFITPEKYDDLASYETKFGDIIISRAGTIGKMCVVTYAKKAIISTNLIRLRLDTEKILPMYFSLLMNKWGPKIARLKTGADGSFTHMNTGILNGIVLSVPPLELQNQFAERVQAIEAQKAQAQASLAQAEDLFNSLLQRAFKGELS